MFYLEKLKIQKYNLIKSPTHINFNEGSNYFLGKNGTGKTTLLEIIKAFYSLQFKVFNKENENIDISGIFRSKKDKKVSVDVNFSYTSQISEKESSSTQLQGIINLKKEIVEIRISRLKDNLIIHISESDSFLKINGMLQEVKYDTIEMYNVLLTTYLFKGYKNIKQTKLLKEVVLWFLLDGSSTNRFREGTENEVNFFDQKNKIIINIDSSYQVSNSIFSKSTVFTNEVLNSPKYKEIFKEFAEKVTANEEYATNINLTKDDSSNIKIISEYLDVKNIRMNYYIENVVKSNDQIECTLGSVKVKIYLNNGKEIEYDNLSYGEKRLFNVLLYLFQKLPAYLLDEPINGFHSKYVNILVDQCKKSKSQVFIANQSPVLIDYIEVEEAEEFRKKFVFCQRIKDKMLLKNPTPTEAKNFMEDYDNQFLTTAQILKKQKLW